MTPITALPTELAAMREVVETLAPIDVPRASRVSTRRPSGSSSACARRARRTRASRRSSTSTATRGCTSSCR